MSGSTVRFKVAFRAQKLRDGKAVRIEEAGETPAEPQATPKPQATRIARMLALAYFVERQIEVGAIKDYADAARRLGVSRARMSQVVDLVNLAPSVQERILGGDIMIAERNLRGPLRDPLWKNQEEAVLGSD